VSSTEPRGYKSGYHPYPEKKLGLKVHYARRAYPIFPYRVNCIDVDGVVADFATALVEYAWSHFKVDIPLPPTKYDWWKNYTNIDLIRSISSSPNFYLRVPPIKLSVTDRVALQAILHGSDSLFTTTRFFVTGDKNVTEQTEEWLRGQGFNKPVLRVRNVTVLPHLFWVRSCLNDNLDDTVKLSYAGAYNIFLIDRPYNQGETAPYRIKRVSSIVEMYEQIKGRKVDELIAKRKRRPNPFELQIAMSKLKIMI
jgi:uncharacterized HAD superfamily protein